MQLKVCIGKYDETWFHMTIFICICPFLEWLWFSMDFMKTIEEFQVWNQANYPICV